MSDNFKSNLKRVIQETKTETGQEFGDFILWLFESVNATYPGIDISKSHIELVKFIEEL